MSKEKSEKQQIFSQINTENSKDIMLLVSALDKHPYNSSFMRFIGYLVRAISGEETKGYQKIKIPFKW